MDRFFGFTAAANVENLAGIRDFVERTAAALDADPSAIDDLVLAVDEAATNIIQHGYRGAAGKIEIVVEGVDEALVVRISDQAPPFDPTQVPPPDLSLPLERRQPGNLGIYIIKQLVDEVIYTTPPQGGNQLILRKRIK
jgi:serine/threonine-protein kinase RsbW